jgi:hypothetical protein
MWLPVLVCGSVILYALAELGASYYVYGRNGVESCDD